MSKTVVKKFTVIILKRNKDGTFIDGDYLSMNEKEAVSKFDDAKKFDSVKSADKYIIMHTVELEKMFPCSKFFVGY